MKRPAVYLIGAGPGDPRLITAYGLECLRVADVVVYDHVVSQRLLRQARSLKDKRQVVQSIKDRLRNEYNVSVAEVGDPDNRQLAELGLAMVGTEAHPLKVALGQIVEALRRHPVAELVDHRTEV